MEACVKNQELVIVLGERIDYSNAGEVEAELFDAVKEHPGLKLCLDADKMLYISSAGLRIMMRLRKTCTAGFSIRNVSPAVYEIFDMTGMTEIIDVRKKRRRFEKVPPGQYTDWMKRPRSRCTRAERRCSLSSRMSRRRRDRPSSTGSRQRSRMMLSASARDTGWSSR